MSSKTSTMQRQEQRIAALLYYGTGLASGVIGVGLAWQVLGSSFSLPVFKAVTGLQLITVGIGMFICLPITRVLLMLLMFLRERDYAFSLIAAIVLGIIASGFIAGIQMR